jgi:uncharacterized membrane protein
MPDLGIAEILTTAVVWALWIGIFVVLGRGLLALLRRHDSAMDTLRSRLAAGEIDEVEFERLRSALQRR